MNYEEAIRYIIDRSGWDKGFVANPFLGEEEVALGLKRTASLVRRLGNPDQTYRVVHVAGTKGKGSTCAMIAAVARAAGLSTGVYATPHLHTFRERMLIDDEPVSEVEFAAIADLAAEADRALRAEEPEIGEPTAFEIATAMTLLAFARAGVDLAVVEVGLGGRLDATNIVDPAVAVITSISYDHMAILGDTLAEIAAEKGGIIKPRRPVVIAPQAGEAEAVLEKIAAEREAPMFVAGRDWQALSTPDGPRLAGSWGDWLGVRMALRGQHQIENAGAALMALYLLHPAILSDEARVREALGSVRWPGRLERIMSAPEVWADGAHNVDSIKRLVDALVEIAPGTRITFILGVGRDKDIDGIARTLALVAGKIFATASHNPRAATPERVAEAAASAGIEAQIAPSVATAIQRARAQATIDGVICVTGSLYAVAEAREAAGLAETPVFERALLYG